MLPTSLIRLEHVQKSYGRRQVLHDVSFTVSRQQMVGIVGENGAGKSTLLKCLVGLLKHDRGTITLWSELGYCPQESLLIDSLTCIEQLTLFAAAYGVGRSDLQQRSQELCEVFNCTKYLHTHIGNLSGGTKQKFNLIAALLHDPDIIVLDEPYQGFDYDTYIAFWNYAERLRDSGKAVVVVSHMISENQRFDQILNLREGIIA